MSDYAATQEPQNWAPSTIPRYSPHVNDVVNRQIVISRYPEPSDPESLGRQIGIERKLRNKLSGVVQDNPISHITPGVDYAERFATDPKRIPARVERNSAFRHPVPGYFHKDNDDQSVARLNGNHFTMATNIRDYPIYGMEPARRFRNTRGSIARSWGTYLLDDSVDVNDVETEPKELHYSPNIDRRRYGRN